MEIVKTDLYWYEFIDKNPEFTGRVIDRYGSKAWFLNGKHHRTDGPAIELSNGYKAWYLNGECLTEEEWTYTVRLNKLEVFLGSN